jgi:predicted RNA-binding protein with PUA-like domain
MARNPNGTRNDRPIKYWAFCANPKIYRIEAAIDELEEDHWTVKNHDVRAGDKFLVWKSLGNSDKRGIVGVGEVLADPSEYADHDVSYWNKKSWAEEKVRRAKVSYQKAGISRLPIWLQADSPSWMTNLTVARGQRTVFKVTEREWESLTRYLKGWSDAAVSEESKAASAIAELAGKGASGQGFNSTAEERKAIEDYSMNAATEYMTAEGWQVEDVSRNHSVDLECSRQSEKLFVEVKGTQSPGSTVLLTRNEVKFNREHQPNVGLFIHYGIRLNVNDDGQTVASGGSTRFILPWLISDASLKPVGYSHTVPDNRAEDL